MQPTHTVWSPPSSVHSLSCFGFGRSLVDFTSWRVRFRRVTDTHFRTLCPLHSNVRAVTHPLATRDCIFIEMVGETFTHSSSTVRTTRTCLRRFLSRWRLGTSRATPTQLLWNNINRLCSDLIFSNVDLSSGPLGNNNLTLTRTLTRNLSPSQFLSPNSLPPSWFVTQMIAFNELFINFIHLFQTIIHWAYRKRKRFKCTTETNNNNIIKTEVLLMTNRQSWVHSTKRFVFRFV